MVGNTPVKQERIIKYDYKTYFCNNIFFPIICLAIASCTHDKDNKWALLGIISFIFLIMLPILKFIIIGE